ncbi:VOC family protein [Hydrogenophaga sp. 5NK40-0174]|uniref:VOC family protein n=1 Tax=Hydrogenophaga sp. 5NK40-0174 TaxID=3127649 RepID=UPI003103DC70
MTLAYTPELSASIGVTDLEASLAWYTDVLGFELLYKLDDMGWCELTTGVPGVTVGLSQVETVVHGGGATNVWGVKDINAAKAHLDAKGVRQDGDIQHIPDMVKLITFFDPDGNAMMFAENLQST